MSHPLLGRVLAALPPRLAGLFEAGLVAVAIREGPTPRPPYASTVYRRGSYRFTIVLDGQAVAAASPTALRAMLRHELAHIFLGHFGPEHMACRLPCSVLAEEAEVNSFLAAEELEALTGLFTHLALRRLEARFGPAAAALLAASGLEAGAVDPDEVRAMAGLPPDLPPRWRLLHPLLHPMTGRGRPGKGPPGGGATGDGGDDEGEEGEDGFPCGGVQVDEDAAAEAAGVAAALASSPRGKGAEEEVRRRGWGSGAGGEAIPWTLPPLPPWAQAVMDWARRTVRRTWTLRRLRHRPRIDFLRAARVYRPDRGYDRVRTQGEVAFVVDTSGSMATDLHYARPAIAFLLHHGIAVRFIGGDVQVEVDVLLRPGDDVPAPKGGGGTDICPLVERAAGYRPDGVCIFTDAEMPRWPPPPEGARVLWVVPAGCEPPYGEVAHWTAQGQGLRRSARHRG